MKKRFFARNLVTFILPILVPLIVLGTLSIILSKSHVDTNLRNSSLNSLEKTKQSMEIILQEADEVLINFTHSPKITISLKEILRTEDYSSYDIQSLNFLKSILNATTAAKPYIHSIYIYAYNNTVNPKVFTSNQGVIPIKDMEDREWYTTFQTYMPEYEFWSETRTVKDHAYDRNSKEVLTIYKLLKKYFEKKHSGVIVLNLNQNYINDLLGTQSTFEEQKMLILDEHRKVVGHSANVSDKDIQFFQTTLLNQSKTNFNISVDNKNYILYQLISDNNGWTYLSLTPVYLIYEWPLSLIFISIILIIISFAIALLFTYYFTKKNYQHLMNIINVLEYAETNKQFPPMTNPKDEYEYITQNILKTFIEQRYLKSELSRRKYKLKTMELLALQSQINPHFLFNTLETIKWKTIELTHAPNHATEMVEYLSDILKYSLESPKGQNLLMNEIKYTKDYLSIMSIRYPNKFNVIWDYDTDLINLPVIKLILQPMVENSIYHGIKEKEGVCFIKIKIVRKNDKLIFFVFDTGLGMEKEKLKRLRQQLKSIENMQTDHVGLFNTCKRLKLTYHNKASLNIMSKLEVGTLIRINLPIEQE